MAESVPSASGNRTSGRAAQACYNCHLRKIKCELTAHGTPPCARCAQLDVPCQRFTRKQRSGRILQSVLNSQASSPGTDRPDQSSTTRPHDDIEDLKSYFISLGVGDTPRALAVPGLDDISRRTSILVDFLSQDFSQASISDYQVTFNDNYSNITRILANEFGQGFGDGVFHHRDAPFIKRTQGGIPRTLSHPEQRVLALQGAFYLPRREIADAFVCAFFDRVYPCMPIVDRGLFLSRYHAATSESPDLSLLLLQSILLSGSTTYRHPDLKLPAPEVSRRLCIRARALLENRFEQDRLILVQSHLLFSTFASDSCDDTIQNMWLSIGSAVRIAQGIGMHRSLGKAKASPEMRRQWKRIWWTLFVHDTLCSFEWGRPRAIHLEDCDVELITVDDLVDDIPGALPNPEKSHFFKAICDLCFVIADWLDLLRPNVIRSSSRHRATEDQHVDRISQTRELMKQLQTWHETLPPVLQPPSSCTGFSLWSATLHITYSAALLRFEALVPDDTNVVGEMADQITKTCQDLFRQGLLYSLWTFGIHELDLAMGQHARHANSAIAEVAGFGLDSLRQGLPLIEHLSERNSVASQGSVFYKLLIEKAEAGQIPSLTDTDRDGMDVVHNREEDDHDADAFASILDGTSDLQYDLDFHGLGFSGLAQFNGQSWNWDLRE